MSCRACNFAKAPGLSAIEITKCPVEESNDLIFKEGNRIDRDGKL
jgi:hypothetical protein